MFEWSSCVKQRWLDCDATQASRPGNTKSDRFMSAGCWWIRETRRSSCSLTPRLILTLQGSRCEGLCRHFFTTLAQVAQKSVSEWPVPDLHPIWRVLGAPLHLCIPQQRNVAVLCLMWQLCWIPQYTEGCSVGRRMKTSKAKNWKQVHSLYLLRRFWVISCPGSSVFIWNCERNERPFIFRNKMAAVQESLPTFFFTRNKL